MRVAIRDKRESGVMLVSVIVAVAILSIALTMAISTFFSASRLTKQAVDMTVADNYAEGVMERVSSQPYDQIKTSQVTANLPKLPGARCLVNVGPEEDGLKQVVVVCSWSEGKQQRSVKLSTLVAKGQTR